MTTILAGTKYHPALGNVYLPEKSVSYAARAIVPQRRNIYVTLQFRPRWAQKDLITLPNVLNPGDRPDLVVQNLLVPYRGEIDPSLFKSDLVWCDISANERVDKGGDINVTRLFGAVSGASTAGGVLTAMAVASASLTVAHGDLSLGSGSANVTTNEFTTIGLSRTAATVQNYVATATLDAQVSVDISKTFSVSGTGTAYGAGLFDSTTVSGSFLFVEKNYSNGSASLSSGDTLVSTITITL